MSVILYLIDVYTFSKNYAINSYYLSLDVVHLHLDAAHLALRRRVRRRVVVRVVHGGHVVHVCHIILIHRRRRRLGLVRSSGLGLLLLHK